MTDTSPTEEAAPPAPPPVPPKLFAAQLEALLSDVPAVRVVVRVEPSEATTRRVFVDVVGETYGVLPRAGCPECKGSPTYRVGDKLCPRRGCTGERVALLIGLASSMQHLVNAIDLPQPVAPEAPAA